MLGVFSWYGYDLPLCTRVTHIKNSGFDATMLWWGDELAFRDGSKDEIIDIVRDSGLCIENIHVPYERCNDFWSDSENKRKRLLDFHYEWLDDCVHFNIPMMVMHVTRGTIISEPNLLGIKCIESLVKRAESYGVKIAIENTRVNNVFKDILEELTFKNLGLCYDSSHDMLYSSNNFDILKKYGKRLFATHLSDNDGIEDRHWLPKDGIINWNELFNIFPKDYRGCISLEIEKGLNKITSKEFLNKAYEKAKWIESNLKY